MPKRGRTNDGPALLLLLAALVLAYVAPFALIGLWAYYEYHARRGVDLNVQAGSERSEQRRLLREDIALSSSRIEDLHQEGCDRGLSRRQDGMFDARYGEGRELNALISAETNAHTYARQQLAAVSEPLARRDAARFALIGYFGVLLWLWSRSSHLSGFARSAWASVIAVVIGLITYAVRKAVTVHWMTLPNQRDCPRVFHAAALGAGTYKSMFEAFVE